MVIKEEIAGENREINSYQLCLRPRKKLIYKQQNEHDLFVNNRKKKQ